MWSLPFSNLRAYQVLADPGDTKGHETNGASSTHLTSSLRSVRAICSSVGRSKKTAYGSPHHRSIGTLYRNEVNAGTDRLILILLLTSRFTLDSINRADAGDAVEPSKRNLSAVEGERK